MHDVWQIFKDDSLKQFEILGIDGDDRELTHRTAQMQKRWSVRCETAETTKSRAGIVADFAVRGYEEVPGLFRKRCDEFDSLERGGPLIPVHH